MNFASEILRNIMDENPKDVMKNVNSSIVDKLSSKMEEKRTEVISAVYEKKNRKHDYDGDGDEDGGDYKYNAYVSGGMDPRLAYEKSRKFQKRGRRK